MTASHQIQADGKVYTVVDDVTSVYRAVITGAVTDEILGGAVQEKLTVQADRPDLLPKVVPNGLFAFTGYVEQAFPQLGTTSYTVHITVSASGFQSQILTVTIPANATFPVPAVTVALRRKPVLVQGRVVANTAIRTPIGGAKVTVVDDPMAPPGPHLVSFRSPLKIAHAASATAQEIAMAVFGSAVLKADASSGASALNLSTRTGLGVNSVVRLSNLSGTRVEYAIVASLGPGSGAGQAFLRDPLNSTFLVAGSTVDFLNPGAVGAAGTLSVGADAGDGVASISKRLDHTVAIDPGTPNVEYLEVGALTDAAGYYSLNGAGRSIELFLEASHGGFTSLARNWFIEYDNAVNVVDFRL